MCPVCTVTVIAGLGISRLLGIDDAVTSLWIGGFILSFSFITISWIDKKWPGLKVQRYRLSVIALLYFLVRDFWSDLAGLYSGSFPLLVAGRSFGRSGRRNCRLGLFGLVLAADSDCRRLGL